MEPKVIIVIIGFVALAVLIVVLLCRKYKDSDGSIDGEAVGKMLCRKYKDSDGSIDGEAVGKIILILLFWWVLIFVVLIKGIVGWGKKK